MDRLPQEIVSKIMLYAISTPSAECIKSVGYLEWRFLSARYLQELYISNPCGFNTDVEAERYWYNYKSRKAKFISDS